MTNPPKTKDKGTFIPKVVLDLMDERNIRRAKANLGIKSTPDTTEARVSNLNADGIKSVRTAAANSGPNIDTQNWEEEFDEEFVWENGTYRHEPKYIKSFIRSAIADAVAETKAEQNRISNSGRKLYQIGQANLKAQLREQVEGIIPKEKHGDLYTQGQQDIGYVILNLLKEKK